MFTLNLVIQFKIPRPRNLNGNLLKLPKLLNLAVVIQRLLDPLPRRRGLLDGPVSPASGDEERLGHGSCSDLGSAEEDAGEVFVNRGFRDREEGEVGLGAGRAEEGGRRRGRRREAAEVGEGGALDTGDESVRGGGGGGGERVVEEFEAVGAE